MLPTAIPDNAVRSAISATAVLLIMHCLGQKFFCEGEVLSPFSATFRRRLFSLSFSFFFYLPIFVFSI